MPKHTVRHYWKHCCAQYFLYDSMESWYANQQQLKNEQEKEENEVDGFEE